MFYLLAVFGDIKNGKYLIYGFLFVLTGFITTIYNNYFIF